jgi:hypothetical protein
LEELHPFDVPVGLFGLAVEVRRIGQVLVEQGRRVFADLNAKSFLVESITFSA